MRPRTARVSPRSAPDLRSATRRSCCARFGEHDVDELAAALQDPEIPRWTGVPSPYTRGHAIQFVTSWPEEAGELSLAIRDAERRAGCSARSACASHDDRPRRRARVLGRRGSPRARRRLAGDRARRALGARRARASSASTSTSIPRNAASLRAAEKAGSRAGPGTARARLPRRARAVRAAQRLSASILDAADGPAVRLHDAPPEQGVPARPQGPRGRHARLPPRGEDRRARLQRLRQVDLLRIMAGRETEFRGDAHARARTRRSACSSRSRRSTRARTCAATSRTAWPRRARCSTASTSCR